MGRGQHALLVASTIGFAALSMAMGGEAWGQGYIQSNLVSDGGAGGGGVNIKAKFTDPQLQNPWGISFLPGSPFWVSDNNTNLTTLYNGDGTPFTPAAAGGGFIIPGGAASGQVANANNNPAFGTFMIPNAPGTSGTAPADFIFDSENGIISAWQPGDGQNAVTLVDNSASHAVYKGLAMASNTAGFFLYATNFHAGRVEMYDSTFKLVKSFSDPGVPAGFAPFGIANIGGDLYVTFAKQNAAKHDDVAGPGNGYVDIFNSNGILIRRFASQGALNSPWGVALAPSDFGVMSNAVLIGNFGNGWINAYSTSGQFLGAMTDTNSNPIHIDGLWSIAFGSSVWGGVSGALSNALYFTAGPGNEMDGVFGTLLPQKTSGAN